MKVRNFDESGRLNYVDSLKGIAIIFVLLGHRSFSSFVTQVIYLFHMPLFFFISGYLDKMKDESMYIIAKRKAKSLIYPYIVFGILILVYNTFSELLRGEIEKQKFLKRVIAFLFGNYIWENNIEYIGVLWFLVCLFFSVLIANIAYRFSEKTNMGIVIWGISLMAAGGICSYAKMRFGYRLPWCIDVAFIGTIFYLVGVYWKRWKKRDKYETLLTGFGFLIIGFIFGIINLLYMKDNNYELLRNDMLQMNYGNLPIFIFSASLMSIGIMIIIKKFCEEHNFNVFGYIGQLSLLIMIDHLYIYQIFDILLCRMELNRWIIFFPFTLAVSIILAAIVHRFIPVLYDYKKLPFAN